MDERAEYWWIRYGSEVRPAQVGFIGGIPAQVRLIGSSDTIPAVSVELIERLPNPPASVFRQHDQQAAPAKPQRSSSLLWLVGILLLILVAQCSGTIFDAIK